VTVRHRSERLRRGARLVSAAAIAACASLVLGPSAPALAASGSATATKTVQRYVIDSSGKKTTIAKRTVTVSVDRTTNLRSLQLVHVSWSGARPTAGIVGDQNSDLAQNEEYSMVLLECRGVDSTKVPVAQQVRPQTCWTQFADERFYYGYDAWPAWRSDAAATKTDRAALVNAPKNQPTVCKNTLIGTANQRWVPFNAASGQAFQGGPFGCAGQAPEAAPANLSSLSLPSNETYGVTGLDGKGAAQFDIFSGEDHSSLGCSQTVPCSLVAIPIMGINCDSSGTLVPPGQRPSPDELASAQANCQSTGNFTAGRQIPPGQSGADAVDGRLWWSASNWNNRITIPLTFAPPDNACRLAAAQTPVNVYGSELLIQATTQWAPTFCLNSKLFNFSHVQTPEPQAANLLKLGNIEAAFISRPPDGGFTTPTVMAPAAVTGFGIAFAVDGADGQPVAHLKLDARLLAKLLTQSYPDIPLVKQSEPGMGNNPLNITFDPEFQALNPGIPAKIQDAAAALLTVNTDSDLIHALTSYINADADARAWLDGAADPWGMTVNPAYKGIGLPVQNWPLLDSYTAKFDFGINPCLWSNPVPYLPLVAAPTARLFNIGQDMQFSIAQSQTVCLTPSPDPTSLAGAKLVARGRQQSGARFMLGTVSLGDAAREGLQLAELETQKSASAPAQFTDATGRTFIAPTTGSLRTAAKLLTPSSTGKYWTLPYSALRSNAADAQAYPGTMPVYAAVPTTGIPPGDAKNLATLLRYVATNLQQPGTGQGKLPPGYLPITAANGLGSLANYTQVAAAAITAQRGAVPALGAKLPQLSGGSSSSTAAPTGPVTGPSNGPNAGRGGPGNLPSVGSSSSPSTRPSASPSSSDGTSSPAATPAAYSQRTPKLDTGSVALLVPVLAGIVIVFGGAAMVVRRYGRTGGHQ
jgi:hypothetical protein